MSDIILQRLIDNGECTQGVLVVARRTSAADTKRRPYPTIERPWQDNKANFSSIPPGSYGYRVAPSPRFGRPLIRLADDELPGGRFAILLHPANVATELLGCIAPGMDFATFRGERGVSNSRRALEEIMEAAPEEGRIIIHPTFAFTGAVP